MNPEQQTFTDIRRLCIQLYGADDVYDYTPPAGTAYPFIRIGEVFKQNRRLHKQDLNGDIQPTIHFWHDDVYERGTLTSMMSEVETAVINQFGVRGEDITSRVMDDNTTSVTLLHGILEINIKRYKGEI